MYRKFEMYCLSIVIEEKCDYLKGFLRLPHILMYGVCECDNLDRKTISFK